MKNRFLIAVLLAFGTVLSMGCSDNDTRIGVAPPMVLAIYSDVFFESINPTEDEQSVFTRYGFSMDFNDRTLAHLFIRNNSRTYFNTIFTGEGSNFISYSFQTTSGNWRVTPSESFRPRSGDTVLTTISGGSGDGSFALRGGITSGVYSDVLLRGNVRGDDRRVIRYSRVIRLGNNIQQTPNIPDNRIMNTFIQAGIETQRTTPGGAILFVDFLAATADFRRSLDTIFINPLFYGRYNSNQVLVMAIAYRYGLEIDYNAGDYNLMNPNSGQFHLNHEQWETLRSRAH